MDNIFLDSNAITNHVENHFFGNFNDLKKAGKSSKIFIPAMVIDELRNQKKKYFFNKLKSAKDNYFFKKFSNQSEDFYKHINEKIAELEKKSLDSLNYEIIYLNESLNHFKVIKDLAINNKPPFEENSDKGFKDAYICLAIKDYINDNNLKNVYIISNDSRVKVYFEDMGIIVLKDINSYLESRKAQFADDYFIERLASYLTEEGAYQPEPFIDHDGESNIETIDLSDLKIDESNINFNEDDNTWEVPVAIQINEQVILNRFIVYLDSTKEFIKWEEV